MPNSNRKRLHTVSTIFVVPDDNRQHFAFTEQEDEVHERNRPPRDSSTIDSLSGNEALAKRRSSDHERNTCLLDLRYFVSLLNEAVNGSKPLQMKTSGWTDSSETHVQEENFLVTWQMRDLSSH